MTLARPVQVLARKHNAVKQRIQSTAPETTSRVPTAVAAAVKAPPLLELSTTNFQPVTTSPSSRTLFIAPKTDGPASVSGIHYYSVKDSTTVAIDIDNEVKYEVHRLTSPERIYVDLKRAHLEPESLAKTLNLNELTVSKNRVAQWRPEVTRIAMETNRFYEYSTYFTFSPAKLAPELLSARRRR